MSDQEDNAKVDSLVKGMVGTAHKVVQNLKMGGKTKKKANETRTTLVD